MARLLALLGTASGVSGFGSQMMRSGLRTSAIRMAAVGDKFPAVSVDFGFPPTKVPGYLAKQAELKAKGVDEVLVYCVNDGAVMKAWAADQGVEGSMITFLADTRCELTEALKLVLDHPGPMSVLGNARCKRFALYAVDGVIKVLNVSEAPDDPAGDTDPSKSLVENMLNSI